MKWRQNGIPDSCGLLNPGWPAGQAWTGQCHFPGVSAAPVKSSPFAKKRKSSPADVRVVEKQTSTAPTLNPFFCFFKPWCQWRSIAWFITNQNNKGKKLHLRSPENNIPQFSCLFTASSEKNWVSGWLWLPWTSACLGRDKDLIVWKQCLSGGPHKLGRWTEPLCDVTKGVFMHLCMSGLFNLLFWL